MQPPPLVKTALAGEKIDTCLRASILPTEMNTAPTPSLKRPSSRSRQVGSLVLHRSQADGRSRGVNDRRSPGSAGGSCVAPCSRKHYLIQELSRLLGQRVMGEHAVITINAVPGRVVQLTGKITFSRHVKAKAAAPGTHPRAESNPLCFGDEDMETQIGKVTCSGLHRRPS